MIEYKSNNSDLRPLQAASFCGVRILETIHLRWLRYRRPCVRDSIKFWRENVDQDPHWVSLRLEIMDTRVWIWNLPICSTIKENWFGRKTAKMDGCNLLWISAPLWDGKEKGDSLTTILICRLLLSDYWTPPPENRGRRREALPLRCIFTVEN